MLYLLGSLIVGSYLATFPLCGLIIDLMLIIHLWKKSKKKWILLFLSIQFVAIIRVLPSSISENSPFKGYILIVDSKDNYALGKTIKGNVYLSAFENDWENGDILYGEGSISKIAMHSIESSFDFAAFLNNKGYSYELKLKTHTISFKAPLRKKAIIGNAFKDYPLVIQDFLKGVVFGVSHIGDSSLAFLYLLSGINIYAIVSLLKKVLHLMHLKPKYDFIAYILLAPYLWVVWHKFFVRRFVVHEIIKLTTKKSLGTRLDKTAFSFIVLWLFDPFIMRQTACLLSLVCSLAFLLNRIYIKDSRWKTASFLFFLNTVIDIILNKTTVNLLSFFFRLIFLPINSLFTVLALFYLLSGLGRPLIISTSNLYLSILHHPLLSFFDINIGQMSIIFIVVVSILSYAFIKTLEMRWRRAPSIMALIMAMVTLVFSYPIDNKFRQGIYFVDVGQGDAILIENRNHYAMIDTGGNINFDIAGDCLMPFFAKYKIHKFDYVFITHNDYDHAGSLTNLRQDIAIGEVVTNFTYKKWQSLEFFNLNPGTFSSPNDNSLVIYLSFMHKKWLFMGDASIAVEEYLCHNHPPTADIIKIGHHGSSTSSSESFLRAVNPRTAIISVGYQNQYHHPSPSVIDILHNLHIAIRRTDQEGTIIYQRYTF